MIRIGPPLMGATQNEQILERRIRDLESLLSKYQESPIVVLRESGQTRRCHALVSGSGGGGFSINNDAQSHYFGPAEVTKNENGSVTVIPVTTHFFEISNTNVQQHDITTPASWTFAPGSENLIYISFTTSNVGVVTSSEITVNTTTSTLLESTIHVPPSQNNNSGVDGSYHTLIGIYHVSSEGELSYEPVSSPSWQCIDRKIANLGAGIELHKLTTSSEEQFRTINQLETGAQVGVVLEGDTIRVRGNDFDGDITVESSTKIIEVVDGLVTELGDLEAVTLSYCDDGSVVTGKFLKLV